MSRTTATILFTDLVGSTELRGRLGEEAADELRRRHDRLLTEAVDVNNGRMVKGLGDGIMAAFAGAADAVAAAVSIQQAIDRLNRSGKAPVPLAVRVGLSAGDVAFEEEDVHGTPVIEASRLCAAATGAEILASDLVVRLAGSVSPAALAAVGPVDLRGLDHPVAAVRVEWQPVTASSIPMPALLTDVGRIFVGRDAELEGLHQLWKQAVAGERRVALVAGEPGVGKTRLAAEVAIRVYDEGGVVLAGRCDEDLGVPYQPFVEALQHYASHTPRPRLGRYGGELTRLAPEALHGVPDLGEPMRSDPETERYRLFDALAAWLADLSIESPVLLVLDDVQWAAKPTVQVLRHLVRFPDPMSLLIVPTYRDTDVGRGHPLRELLADLRRVGGVERFLLSGLDAGEVEAFLEQAAGHSLDRDGQTLARMVWRETEGNPFFLSEVLRHLSKSGAVARRNGRWVTTASLASLGIPEGVRDVVGARLSRLSDAANRTLAVAAVVGVTFEPEVVRTAGDLEDEDVVNAIDEAVRARLLSEAPGRQYRFSHSLVRATLYDELSSVRRLTLHRRVAESIESAYAASLDDHLPALVHHWTQISAPGTDTAKAVEYAARAGDRALVQLAHDEAVGYYHQALELIEMGRPWPDERRRLDLLISLGAAERLAGKPEHRQTLLEAARLAEDRGDAGLLARAALENIRASIFSATGIVDVDRVRVLEAAVARLNGGDDSVRARLLAALALELTFGPDPKRRRRISDEALGLARRSDDASALAYVLAARFFPIFTPATVEERRSNIAELSDLIEDGRLEDPVMVGFGHYLSWRMAIETAAASEAERHLETLEDLSHRVRNPTLRWTTLFARTARRLLVGDLAGAEARAREGYEEGKASGQPDAVIVFAGPLVALALETGQLQEARDVWLEIADGQPCLALPRAVLAMIESRGGDAAAADWYLADLAEAGFDNIPDDTLWPSTLACAAMAATELQHRQVAARLFELLAPYPEHVIGIGEVWFGSVAHHLATLATVLGRYDIAESNYAAAADVHARLDARTWLARTQLEWGRMLLTRRQGSDVERGRAFLSQACATARDLGLPNVGRGALELMQACP